jgi:hypothetical protein
MRKIILAFALLASVAFGQEARVIEIKPEDSAELKQKWEALQVAQNAWDQIHVRITNSYTVVKEGDKDAGGQVFFQNISGGQMGAYWTTDSCHVLWVDSAHPRPQEDVKRCEDIQRKAEKNRAPMLFYRRGWERGFQFTPDFRYIVPKPEVTPQPNNQFWQFGTTSVIAPATGIFSNQ